MYTTFFCDGTCLMPDATNRLTSRLTSLVLTPRRSPDSPSEGTCCVYCSNDLLLCVPMAGAQPCAMMVRARTHARAHTLHARTHARLARTHTLRARRHTCTHATFHARLACTHALHVRTPSMYAHRPSTHANAPSTHAPRALTHTSITPAYQRVLKHGTVMRNHLIIIDYYCY